MAWQIEPRVVRAAAWRLRWVGALILAAVLVRIAVPAVIQALRQTSPAVVVTQAVTMGQRLEAQDLTVAQVAKGLVPDGALDSVDQAVGQQVTAALPRGMVLVPELLAQPGAIGAAPAGLVLVPVRLSDGAVAGLLQVGDRIDVLGAGGASASGQVAPAQRLASGAKVMALPPGDGDFDSSGLVMLAVKPSEAELLGGAASWAVISAVLVG